MAKVELREITREYPGRFVVSYEISGVAHHDRILDGVARRGSAGELSMRDAVFEHRYQSERL